ncbi:MAG: sugar ABC transporter permease [Spirochaetales bacterium]|nr:sugar ABC transporter permease [Spirochaetales bacterium]
MLEKKSLKTGNIKNQSTQIVLSAMALPFLILVLVFNYIPIWGWITAFQSYRLGHSFLDQEWVGLKWFIELSKDQRFFNALINTLGMSFMQLVVNFTFPIIFAILLNELRFLPFKKIVQTVSYLPHFVSWVVVAGMVYMMTSTDGGLLNNILVLLGFEPVQFMANPDYFWFIVTISDLWKEMGWNAIIFLAAITSIDPQIYEAAKVDGAGKFRQIVHVTLPGISHVIVVLLILSIGNIISIGFEKQFLLGNSIVLERSEVIDLYALGAGINQGRFSYGTAIGMFKSLVSLILLFSANNIFKKSTDQSVF